MGPLATAAQLADGLDGVAELARHAPTSSTAPAAAPTASARPAGKGFFLAADAAALASAAREDAGARARGLRPGRDAPALRRRGGRRRREIVDARRRHAGDLGLLERRRLAGELLLRAGSTTGRVYVGSEAQRGLRLRRRPSRTRSTAAPAAPAAARSSAACAVSRPTSSASRSRGTAPSSTRSPADGGGRLPGSRRAADPGARCPLERPIASLFASAERGDPEAAAALFAALYSELHRLASRQLARAGPGSGLGTTSLLHEAYLDLSRGGGAEFPDQARFLGYAARVMRGLVIDAVRRRQADKRGGRFRITSVEDKEIAAILARPGARASRRGARRAGEARAAPRRDRRLALLLRLLLRRDRRLARDLRAVDLPRVGQGAPAPARRARGLTGARRRQPSSRSRAASARR